MPEFDPKRLRARRLARSLTADQTAVQAGRSTGAYYKYESGRLQPSVPTLCRLAQVLDCQISDFFDPATPSNVLRLSEDQRTAIREQVLAMAPLSDEDIDSLARVISEVRRLVRQDGAA